MSFSGKGSLGRAAPVSERAPHRQLFLYKFFFLSIHLSFSLFIYLYIHLSILYTCPFTYLSVVLSTSIYLLSIVFVKASHGLLKFTCMVLLHDESTSSSVPWTHTHILHIYTPLAFIFMTLTLPRLLLLVHEEDVTERWRSYQFSGTILSCLIAG